MPISKFPANDIIATGSITATAQNVALAINGQSSATIQVTGTWVGTMIIEGTTDGTTWLPINGVSAASFTPTPSVSSNNLYRITPGALTSYRILSSGTWTSGTAVITLKASIGTGGIFANQILPVVSIPKAIYKASTIIPLVTAVTVNVPFFNIIGSATKTVIVKKITVSGMSLTAVGYFAINAEKLSTASTAGTSTTLVATALDSSSAAVTSVVKAYTAAPTKGTLVGTLKSYRALWQATVAAAAGTTSHYDFIFGDIDNSSGIVLRGIAQELALTFPVVLASAGTLSVDIEWTEE